MTVRSVEVAAEERAQLKFDCQFGQRQAGTVLASQ